MGARQPCLVQVKSLPFLSATTQTMCLSQEESRSLVLISAVKIILLF